MTDIMDQPDLTAPWLCEEPGCPRTFPTLQGMRMHMTRSHSVLVDPIKELKAVQKKNDAKQQAEMFKRLEKATRALVPDPKDLYARFEEVAHLREQMLDFLMRGK